MRRSAKNSMFGEKNVVEIEPDHEFNEDFGINASDAPLSEFFLPCALRKAVLARFDEALRAGIISDDAFPIFVTSSEVIRGRPTSDERSSEFIRGGDVTVYTY